MVSSTQQTDRRRAIRHKSAGKRSAAKRAKLGSTPRFPIHLEGYDLDAADAKRPATAASSDKK
ncbi:MAG: hypothetical protein JW751_31785 [Polyangiaceae bacterium]|nr:hypothetical protein [Polyangiaceae bacterium]